MAVARVVAADGGIAGGGRCSPLFSGGRGLLMLWWPRVFYAVLVALGPSITYVRVSLPAPRRFPEGIDALLSFQLSRDVCPRCNPGIVFDVVVACIFFRSQQYVRDGFAIRSRLFPDVST